jgi:hypothetical protein
MSQEKIVVVLTGLVIDVVHPDLGVVRLLPTKRKFIADAVGETQWLG